MLTNDSFKIMDEILSDVQEVRCNELREVFHYLKSITCNYELISETYEEPLFDDLDDIIFITDDIIQDVKQFMKQATYVIQVNNITITNNQIPDYVSHIFGYLCGIMVCIQEVPQFIKIIRTKSTDDLSIIGLILRCISGVIWFIYGFLTKSTITGELK